MNGVNVNHGNAGDLRSEFAASRSINVFSQFRRVRFGRGDGDRSKFWTYHGIDSPPSFVRPPADPALTEGMAEPLAPVNERL